MKRCKFLFIFLNICAFCLLLLSCNDSVREDSSFKWVKQPEVEWNYLIYMGADNNLERFAIKNIEALQKIGTNSNANILVLFDRSPGYDKTNENRVGTELLRITENPLNLNADVIKDYGELDMTDSRNLYDFLCLINEYFPAKHTVLDMWGHGYGLYPDGIIPASKGFIADYTTGVSKENTMSVYSFADAVKRYETDKNAHIDIIQFDTCLMQSIETCYQLRNLTDYIIGAETEIPGSGSDYKAIASYLTANANIGAETLAEFLVSSFYEYEKNSSTPFSMSVVKTADLDAFMGDFNNMCVYLLAGLHTSSTDVLNLRENLTKIDSGYVEYADLYEVIDMCYTLGIDTSSVLLKFENVVLNSVFSDDILNKTKGISINFPYTSELADYYFKDEGKHKYLEFYKDSDWGKVLCALCGL